MVAFALYHCLHSLSFHFYAWLIAFLWSHAACCLAIDFLDAYCCYLCPGAISTLSRGWFYVDLIFPSKYVCSFVIQEIDVISWVKLVLFFLEDMIVFNRSQHHLLDLKPRSPVDFTKPGNSLEPL